MRLQTGSRSAGGSTRRQTYERRGRHDFTWRGGQPQERQNGGKHRTEEYDLGGQASIPPPSSLALLPPGGLGLAPAPFSQQVDSPLPSFLSSSPTNRCPRDFLSPPLGLPRRHLPFSLLQAGRLSPLPPHTPTRTHAHTHTRTRTGSWSRSWPEGEGETVVYGAAGHGRGRRPVGVGSRVGVGVRVLRRTTHATPHPIHHTLHHTPHTPSSPTRPSTPAHPATHAGWRRRSTSRRSGATREPVCRPRFVRNSGGSC